MANLNKKRPDEWYERVKSLFSDHHMSAGDIAKILSGEDKTVTRNVICGALARHGINRVGQTPKIRPPRAPRQPDPFTGSRPPSPLKTSPAPSQADLEASLPLLEARDGHCRYLLTDGPEFRVCAQPVLRGSWCSNHFGRVYNLPKEKRDDKLAGH